MATSFGHLNSRFRGGDAVNRDDIDDRISEPAGTGMLRGKLLGEVGAPAPTERVSSAEWYRRIDNHSLLCKYSSDWSGCGSLPKRSLHGDYTTLRPLPDGGMEAVSDDRRQKLGVHVLQAGMSYMLERKIAICALYDNPIDPSTRVCTYTMATKARDASERTIFAAYSFTLPREPAVVAAEEIWERPETLQQSLARSPFAGMFGPGQLEPRPIEGVMVLDFGDPADWEGAQSYDLKRTLQDSGANGAIRYITPLS